MTVTTYGIDFGTTNSAIAFMDTHRSIVVPVGKNGRKMIRSELFFSRDDDAIYVGDAAFDEYLASEKWGRFIQSIKSVLPSRLFTSTRIGTTEYEAEDLIALILEFLKKKADGVTGRNVKKVVLGRPVTFAGDGNNEQLAEQRLRTAAEYAGFDEIAFQFEPIAAAMAYEQTLASEKLVLVADLGGGTSDFSLIRLGPKRKHLKNRAPDVLATAGVGMAGDALDSAIMSSNFRDYFGAHVQYENWPGQWLSIPSSVFIDLCHKGRVIYLYNEGVQDQLRDIIRTADDPLAVSRLLRLVENNLGHQVYETIESGKKELSNHDFTQIQFAKEGLELRLDLSRSQFNDIIHGTVSHIEHGVDALLRSAGVAVSDIDTVYMTGGTSLVPRLQALMQTKFPFSALEISEDSFLSVVNGLALCGPTR
ncbi:Hsp70 family protein [bacterium]|nr:Hsp70 family protein [candidate division CSSED10-310 bacterium]